jgi:hypothetical protein
MLAINTSIWIVAIPQGFATVTAIYKYGMRVAAVFSSLKP